MARHLRLVNPGMGKYPPMAVPGERFENLPGSGGFAARAPAPRTTSNLLAGSYQTVYKEPIHFEYPTGGGTIPFDGLPDPTSKGPDYTAFGKRRSVMGRGGSLSHPLAAADHARRLGRPVHQARGSHVQGMNAAPGDFGNTAVGMGLDFNSAWNSIVQPALESGAGAVAASALQSAGQDPTIQAAATQQAQAAAGSAVGSWLIKNWMYVAGGSAVALVGVYLLARRKRS